MTNKNHEKKVKSTSEIAEEALLAASRAQTALEKTMGIKPGDAEYIKKHANMTARNVMQEDIGLFGEPADIPYLFDDETRDRLIAHTRQDAANAMILGSGAIDGIERLQKSARNLSWVSFILLGLVLLLLWVVLGGRS